MEIKCPHCHHIREYFDDGKVKRPQVRCPNCSKRYYVSSNVIIKPQEEISVIKEDLTLGTDFDRTVLIAGLMDTIKIYKNKFLDRDGKILPKANSREGKKVLEWVEMWNDQKTVPMLVVYQAYFQKVDLAYKELKKLRV